MSCIECGLHVIFELGRFGKFESSKNQQGRWQILTQLFPQFNYSLRRSLTDRSTDAALQNKKVAV